MIELFDFQQTAAAQIADRFGTYWADRPWHGGKKTGGYVPFYQSLASITASGKTVMVAEAVKQMTPVLPMKPVIVWVSKGKVVVNQTYTNFQEGGKYSSLLHDFEVRYLSEFSRSDCRNTDASLLYVATVGTFNQKDKEKSDLRLFKSDVDNADSSIWQALKERVAIGLRRPLIIVYDEGHNCTDNQTNHLLELEPDALLLASGTPKLPKAILKIANDLQTDLGWGKDDLTTKVRSRDVVDAGLVKKSIALGGHQEDMEPTVSELLTDMAALEAAAEKLKLSITPKAIYVCRTNIVESNSLTRDDPKQPFEHRQAPPIRIWRYLVNEKGIDPAKVAVYTSALTIDKAHPAPEAFIHFKGSIADYPKFIEGGYTHIIFNLGLQEGWDDPECYLAYIDKSMKSDVQIQQIIGRVLRQPNATRYPDDLLNVARFYVRVDEQGVFSSIVTDVRSKLAKDFPDVEIAAYSPGSPDRPVHFLPKEARTVPKTAIDPTEARSGIDNVMSKLLDWRGQEGTPNVIGHGAHALVQQVIGEESAPDFEWVEREAANTVSARWIFQTQVRRLFPRALEIIGSDDPRLDAHVQLGSAADAHIRDIATQAVDAYLDGVRLQLRAHNPYEVGPLMMVESKTVPYKNALHTGYTGLNKLERIFAEELDRMDLVWCRNPSASGYGIPLPSLSFQSKNFYPDFLVWKGKNVFAVDPTAGHLLQDKLSRKLLEIPAHPKAKVRVHVRLISEGKYTPEGVKQSASGYTTWRLGAGHSLSAQYADSAKDALKASLDPPRVS